MLTKTITIRLPEFFDIDYSKEYEEPIVTFKKDNNIYKFENFISEKSLNKMSGKWVDIEAKKLLFSNKITIKRVINTY